MNIEAILCPQCGKGPNIDKVRLAIGNGQHIVPIECDSCRVVSIFKPFEINLQIPDKPLRPETAKVALRIQEQISKWGESLSEDPSLYGQVSEKTRFAYELLEHISLFPETKLLEPGQLSAISRSVNKAAYGDSRDRDYADVKAKASLSEGIWEISQLLEK